MFVRLIIKIHVMKKYKIIGIMIFCASQFFTQCTTDNKSEEKALTGKESNEISVLTNFLSEILGINSEKIIFDSNDSVFIIGGDVLMPLAEAREHFNGGNAKITNKTNQRSTGFPVSNENSKSVKVYLSLEVPLQWQIALKQAINDWNKLNSSINITVVNEVTPTTIIITSLNGGNSGVIASATFPTYDRHPGRSIKINNYYDKLNASEKVSVMTHELGHCFGLNHTDESIGHLVDCTPLSEIGSVMHSTVNVATFTYYDNVAISTLYPVAVGAKKLYRYKKNQYYFYSTNACEIIPSKDGYVFDGDAGYLYSTQITGTVPLFRILNGTTVKDHRLSRTQISSDDVILGYLYPTQELGTVPVHYVLIQEFLKGNPSYMYHYYYSTEAYESIIQRIVGYVPSK